MNKLLMIVACVATLALTSCSEPFDDSAIWEQLDEYGESIRDHEQRISALEELCKQMNTNISSLQTIVAALQNNDYVTAIVPVIKDGITIGYTITFTKSQPITIYHGEDGADGKDGYTPQIGVKQDTDDIYYWTLDGEWLLDASGNKIKAVGTDGKDGQNGADGSNGNDGQNGSDGKDGQDGKDGADGITPQLKIEDGYWYISYDNGTTWTQLGKATGEDGQNGQDGQNGANGKDGQDGDSFFQSVTQDDDFVYFTLADGTIITLPKYKGEEVNENCKIYYTTTDGKKLFLNVDASLYGAMLVSNIYKDGQGVLIFDDVVTSFGNSKGYSYNHIMGDDGCIRLKTMLLPNSVTSIGNGAFKSCTSLTSVTIPDSVTEIGQYAFLDCTGELIVNCNIPSASESSYGAFYASKFTKVTIGKGVTSIGNYAFYRCSKSTSVTIPDSVTSIGNYAFYGCLKLTSVTIPDSVTSIGNGAFFDCSSLTSVTIGNSVTSIGNVAFNGCSSLTSITIPNSVTSIGEGAFNGCSSLTSVTIPDNVTSIGSFAFSDCTSLKDVYCKPTTPPAGGSDMFSYYKSGYKPIGCKIYVPRGSVEAYKAATYWIDYKSSIFGYDF